MPDGRDLEPENDSPATCHPGLPPVTNSLGQHVVLSLPLDSNKYLPAVEPPAEGPEDAEDEEA
jgi:hypothetical protein